MPGDKSGFLSAADNTWKSTGRDRTKRRARRVGNCGKADDAALVRSAFLPQQAKTSTERKKEREGGIPRWGIPRV